MSTTKKEKLKTQLHYDVERGWSFCSGTVAVAAGDAAEDVVGVDCD